MQRRVILRLWYAICTSHVCAPLSCCSHLTSTQAAAVQLLCSEVRPTAHSLESPAAGCHTSTWCFLLQAKQISARVDQSVRTHTPLFPTGIERHEPEIGRASCRERVCQYV